VGILHKCAFNGLVRRWRWRFDMNEWERMGWIGLLVWIYVTYIHLKGFLRTNEVWTSYLGIEIAVRIWASRSKLRWTEYVMHT